jgi:hypothetical protein
LKTVVSGKMYPIDGEEKWIEWLEEKGSARGREREL